MACKASMSYEEEASFSCTTTSLLVHFPTYLALPSLPRGPSCHIRWSLPSSAPRTFTPYTPSPAPYQQGNLVLQPGDCCLLILQCLCIKWWEGGFVCESVCVCARSS